MKFDIKKELLNTAERIDFSEMETPPKFEASENTFSFEVKDNDVRLMQGIINEEIAGPGMDDEQNNVNEYGKMLYWLYDELMLQIKK